MDDRIRISDADRDRVTARLRDHYAEGRLTLAELDERVTTTLNAKTFGDLRPVMADLPDPLPAPSAARRSQLAAPTWAIRHRGPRLLPLLLIIGVAALVLPGAGWLFLAVVKAILVFWLVACLAAVLLVGRFRRRIRRDWQTGFWQTGYRHPGWPGSYSHHGYSHHGRRHSRW